MKNEAVVFDFDGVIVDSVKIKEDAMKDLFPNIEVDLHQGGASRYQKIPYFYKKMTGKEMTDEKLEEYVKKYNMSTLNKILKLELNKDIINFIKENKYKYRFFIVTGTPTNVARYIAYKFGISIYFTNILGTEHCEKHDCLNFIKSSFDKITYIGDMESDRLESNKAGVNFIKYKIGETELWKDFR